MKELISRKAILHQDKLGGSTIDNYAKEDKELIPSIKKMYPTKGCPLAIMPLNAALELYHLYEN